MFSAITAMTRSFLWILFVPTIFGHVALIYPTARYPPLDFLDTARTLGPCGMPKPTNPIYTDFVVGESYNLSWTSSHLLHKGGVRINLLDASGNKIKQIYPENGEWHVNNDLTVPVVFEVGCDGCVLQIERQALEYGPSYIFRSCADINVVGTVSDENERICSGNGVFRSENDGCNCYKGFAGPACQYRVDCQTDSECGVNGKCVESPHSAIKRSCFCAFGFFGANCETEFKNEEKQDLCFNFENLVDTQPPRFEKHGLFDPNCYSKQDLNGQDFIFSRVVGADVEIILDFNTTGWVAIGWRPVDLDTICRLFPDLGVQSRRYRQIHDHRESGFVKSAFDAPLHPMDCVDMVSATVIDGRSKIQDMYSRDRSTPLLDKYFDGEFSLTAGFAVERDGRTIFMFRRNIREIEPSDHPLGPGKIFGIYAKSLDGNDDFYYHGSKNRGTTVFEFVQKEKMANNGPLVFFKDSDSKEKTMETVQVSTEIRTEQVKVESTTISTTETTTNLPVSLETEKPTTTVSLLENSIFETNSNELSSNTVNSRILTLAIFVFPFILPLLVQ
uniref:Uncharacterized protein n=1 Tax=Panagrolaimus sp. JU765 TaxID=591449 RepID=A0AC34QB97_9BILA